MARSLGLEEKLNALPLKERQRGYSPAEMTLTLIGLLQAGGVALDDVSLLRGDAGMSIPVDSIGWDSRPALAISVAEDFGRSSASKGL